MDEPRQGCFFFIFPMADAHTCVAPSMPSAHPQRVHWCRHSESPSGSASSTGPPHMRQKLKACRGLGGGTGDAAAGAAATSARGGETVGCCTPWALLPPSPWASAAFELLPPAGAVAKQRCCSRRRRACRPAAAAAALWSCRTAGRSMFLQHG